jgi:alkylhydroperoxidase family enzyme
VARPATRYDTLIARLSEAATANDPAPPDFAEYLGKVQANAYEVTDGDIRRLREAGYSEDVIFEQTVAVAVAAGLERLEASLGVLR